MSEYRFVEKQTKTLLLKDGYLCLRPDAVEKPYSAFEEFYREKGQEKIAARVEYFKTKMGVNPGEVRVMELKNRWPPAQKNKTSISTGNASWYRLTLLTK